MNETPESINRNFENEANYYINDTQSSISRSIRLVALAIVAAARIIAYVIKNK